MSSTTTAPEQTITGTTAARCQSIAYVSQASPGSGHLQELSHPLSGGAWTVENLTKTYNAPMVAFADAQPAMLTSWVDPAAKHVVYIDVNQHVIEFWSNLDNAGWYWKDLTNEAGAPLAKFVNGGITSYFDYAYKHVLYVARDGNKLQDLYIAIDGGTRWAVCEPGGPPLEFGNSLTATVDSVHGHVFYVTGNATNSDPRQGHVQEVCQRLGEQAQWQHNDLTQSTPGTPKACVGYGIASWVTAGYKHAAFADDATLNIWELYALDGDQTWSVHNDTALASGAPAVNGDVWGGLVGWADSKCSYIAYCTKPGDRSGPGDVAMLSYNLRNTTPAWEWRNLTGPGNLPVVRSHAPGLTSWTRSDAWHVSYTDEQGTIWELYPGPMGITLATKPAVDAHGPQAALCGPSAHVDAPPLSAQQLQEVIAKCGPVVRFFPKEKYKISTIEYFLENSKLHDDRHPGEVTQPNKNDLPVGPRDGDRFWLELNPAAEGGNPADAHAYLHASWSSGLDFTDLQFWFFYAYNGPGTGHIGYLIHSADFDLKPLGAHFGDWECTMVRIDNATRKPISVWLSQHKNGEFFGPKKMGAFNRVGDQIIVYSSYNGHAMYSSTGTNPNNDYSVGGIGFYTPNFTADGGESLDCGSRSQIVATDWLGDTFPEQRWLDYPYRWGPAHTHINITPQIISNAIIAAAGSWIKKLPKYYQLVELIAIFICNLYTDNLDGPEGPKMKTENWRRQY